jgi:uncharacterized protein
MKRPRLRRWASILMLLILPPYLVVAFGCGADWLILRQRSGYVDPQGATRQTIVVEGKTVEAWIARSEKLARDEQPQAYLLEFCGNATRAEDIAIYVASRWRDHPVEAWVMNYPGGGGSDGPARLKRIPAAALAMFDELRRRSPSAPIFVEANSLGTTAALHVAAHRDVAGCILHDPVPLKQLILGEYGWWNLWLVAGPVACRLPDELDAIANAKAANAPAVFILAENDTFVLPKYHRMVTDAYAGEKRFVKMPGGHWSSVTGDAEKQLRQEIDWLWSSALPSPRPSREVPGEEASH